MCPSEQPVGLSGHTSSGTRFIEDFEDHVFAELAFDFGFASRGIDRAEDFVKVDRFVGDEIAPF